MRLALLAATLVILVACDSGEEDAPVTATASGTETASATAVTDPSPSATRPPHYLDSGNTARRPPPFATSVPEPRRTGVTHLDVILAAIENGHVEVLKPLLDVRLEACAPDGEAMSLPAPPICEPGEPAGTSVSVFTIGLGCEGATLREWEEVLPRWVAATRGLYAAVEQPSGEGSEGRAMLIFHAVGDQFIQSPFAVVTSDGGIESLAFGGCATEEDRTIRGEQRLPIIAGPWLDALGAGPLPQTGDESLDRVLQSIHRSSQDGALEYSRRPFILESCFPFGVGVSDLAVAWYQFYAQSPQLHGVFRAPTSPPQGWEDAAWWAIYAVAHNELLGAARVGITEAGRIVGIDYACDTAERAATWGEERLTALDLGEADAPRRSGIAEVDAVIAEVEAGEVAALGDRVRLYEVGCTRRQGLGGPPKCGGDDAEGTVYERFPVAGCSHGTWAEGAEHAISAALASDGLMAVLEGGVTWTEFPGLVTEYGLVYRPAGDSPVFVVIGVTDGAIVSVEYQCGGPYRDSDRIVAGPWGAKD